MHSHGMSRDEYYRYELDRLEREPRRDASTRERWRKEEAWIGAETEIGPMKEEVKKQIIEEYERKKREATAKAEAEEMHIIVRLIREQQEAKAEEKRLFENIEREKHEQRQTAETPQHDPPDDSKIRRPERQPTVADLYQQSLERSIEKKGGIWPKKYKIPVELTGAPRVCQWSIFGHGGIVLQDEPVSEEHLRELTAERWRTGDHVILIENIKHPYIGELGRSLELPVEAFYGLADFEPLLRCPNHHQDDSRAHKLITIDDGIERVFRKAKMLSTEDNGIKAMIHTLGNPLTATRDLLWFFDSHPEGAQRSHTIMTTLLEVIPKILESLPLLERSPSDPALHHDAKFLEALAAQLQGQLEECRLHWLFCMKEKELCPLSIASAQIQPNNRDTKIVCIRAKKDICEYATLLPSHNPGFTDST